MADAPRDWDKELADIDKLMQAGAAAPPAKPAAPGPAPSRGVAGVPPAAASRAARTGAWARALAGAVLAAAMTQWPYAHGCGAGLLLYTAAAGAVVLTGGWGAVASWRARLAAPHLVALTALGWGLALLAAIILPRIGYAAQPQAWLCP